VGPSAPIEQVDTKFPFQQSDLPTERRLHDVQPGGGVLEVQIIGDNHEFSNALRIERWPGIIHHVDSGLP
jgi:hypothetical protein